MANQHCADCVKGVVIPGTPEGKLDKIAGVDAYFAKQSGDSKNAIIITTDVFGYNFVNIQLIADALATHTGYFVVVPDLFNNDPLPTDLFTMDEQTKAQKFAEWRPKHAPFQSKLPIVYNVIKEVKEKYNKEKIGIIGYCFGGGISAVLAADPQVNANVICHPSKLEIPSAIEAIKNPTLWICAETDNTFPEQDRTQAQEILKKKGIDSTFKLYPGTTHGFAARGDPKVPKIESAKLNALEESIHFFNRILN